MLGQLFHSARLDQESADRVEKLMRDAAFAVPLPEPGGEAAEGVASEEQVWAPLLHGLFTALLDLTRSGPLVLTVDDVHHADPASLHCLLYVTRRLRHARIMIVLAEASTLRPSHPLFRAELLSQPYFSRISLPPLTVDAIARMIGDDTEDAQAREAAESLLSMTGGNPLLTRALLDERGRAESADDATPDPANGDGFDQAVLGCLYRHEPGCGRSPRRWRC